MDIRKVKKLIELLEESGIAEIEIKEGEESVRISRMPTGATYAMLPHAVVHAPPPAAAAAAAPAAAAASAAGAPSPPAKPTGHVVTAPMVGTFYSRAVAGRQGFRRDRRRGQGRRRALHHRGDEDDEPDRIATRPARSSRSWSKNGEPVEFGQPLFVIE